MDTLTSRLLSSTNFWSMWKMVRAASMWLEMSHKSCFISSVVVAEKDELLFFSSHSHVYLSVICALEQRLLMPCLWYMTHHTEQLFILWINPERGGKEKKMQTWLPSAGGGLSLFLCAPLLPLLPPPTPYSHDPSHLPSLSELHIPSSYPPLWYWADPGSREHHG